jgi:hypothetical protein
MSETSRFGAATAIMVALLLVGLGALVASRGPSSKGAATQAPHLISMEESGRAMLGAGDVMLVHAEEMLAESERTGDRELAAQGHEWLKDAQELVQDARWMETDPKALASLTTRPSDPAIQANWGALVRGSEAMLHDLKQADSRGVDMEALLWNGQSMIAEGSNMSEHGKVMSEDVEWMVEQHRLQDRAVADLRAVAQAMQSVGSHLAGNGQEMVDYVERFQRSLGIP